MQPRVGRLSRFVILIATVIFTVSAATAAPYADMVMDMRSGKVIHSRNADTPLHPASLTKMMTLYITFQAIEHGEISLDTPVTVSAHAAAEPPSKLGLRAGQKIALRYLIRAAAVKSANDAATAIGEAIGGSEAGFARRMNQTAAALGMTRTHFVNANGLTRKGHLSTARDMTTLGRHLFYDYPQYYNLFSRLSADVGGGRKVPNTNRRFLNSYKGADGIKTGYTNASGFNLVASAQRGSKRIIATVFGGQSTAARNKRMAELLDIGFRNAPAHVAERRPTRPPYQGPSHAGKIVRVAVAPKTSIRPAPRPEVPDASVSIALADTVTEVVEEIASESPSGHAPALTAAENGQKLKVIAATISAPDITPPPPARPAEIILARVEPAPETPPAAREVVTRLSTSGGRHWGINVGRYSSQYEAERVLLKTALVEISTLGEALRKVARTPRGYDANFVGLTEAGADLACKRLEARATDCQVIGPG